MGNESLQSDIAKALHQFQRELEKKLPPDAARRRRSQVDDLHPLCTGKVDIAKKFTEIMAQRESDVPSTLLRAIDSPDDDVVGFIWKIAKLIFPGSTTVQLLRVMFPSLKSVLDTNHDEQLAPEKLSRDVLDKIPLECVRRYLADPQPVVRKKLERNIRDELMRFEYEQEEQAEKEDRSFVATVCEESWSQRLQKLDERQTTTPKVVLVFLEGGAALFEKIFQGCKREQRREFVAECEAELLPLIAKEGFCYALHFFREYFSSSSLMVSSPIFQHIVLASCADYTSLLQCDPLVAFDEVLPRARVVGNKMPADLAMSLLAKRIPINSLIAFFTATAALPKKFGPLVHQLEILVLATRFNAGRDVPSEIPAFADFFRDYPRQLERISPFEIVVIVKSIAKLLRFSVPESVINLFGQLLLASPEGLRVNAMCIPEDVEGHLMAVLLTKNRELFLRILNLLNYTERVQVMLLAKTASDRAIHQIIFSAQQEVDRSFARQVRAYLPSRVAPGIQKSLEQFSLAEKPAPTKVLQRLQQPRAATNSTHALANDDSLVGATQLTQVPRQVSHSQPARANTTRATRWQRSEVLRPEEERQREQLNGTRTTPSQLSPAIIDDTQNSQPNSTQASPWMRFTRLSKQVVNSPDSSPDNSIGGQPGYFDTW